MGVVYLAREEALDRLVAIKVLQDAAAADPQLRERFQREARTAAQLTHANIVPLYTTGQSSNVMYFVMGYVEGESLATRLRREGKLTAEATRRVLSELADALDYAHRCGIVHRDIKPDNILLDADTGRAILTDFGIAKRWVTASTLTEAGTVVGTVHYMSPEQGAGDHGLDGRSDIYSLGVVGYVMLTGQLPFDGPSLRDILVQHATRPPTPIRTLAPDVPSDLEVAITRSLAKAPKHRWPDAMALHRSLRKQDAYALLTPRSWFDGLGFRVLSFVYVFMLLIAAALAFEYGQPSVGSRHSIQGQSHSTEHSDSFGEGYTAGRRDRDGKPGPIKRWVLRVIEAGLPAAAGLPVAAREAVRLYSALYTGILSLWLIISLPLLVVAFWTGRKQGLRLRDIQRQVLRQPVWWRGWFPRGYAHPAMLEIWRRAPLASRLLQSFCDLVTIYLLAIELPGFVFAAALPSETAGAVFVGEWPGMGEFVPEAPALVPMDIVLLLLIAFATGLLIWGRRRGLSLRDARRLATGEALAPGFENLTFWREAGGLHVSGAERDSGSRPESASYTPIEYVRQIARISAEMTGDLAELAREAVAASQKLAADIDTVDREIEKLTRASEPEEIARLQRKVAALGPAKPLESDEDARMRELLGGQLELLQHLEGRRMEALSHRAGLANGLQGLWRALVELREEQAKHSPSVNEVASRVRTAMRVVALG